MSFCDICRPPPVESWTPHAAADLISIEWARSRPGNFERYFDEVKVSSGEGFAGTALALASAGGMRNGRSAFRVCLRSDLLEPFCSSPHFFGRSQAEGIEHNLNSM